LTSVESIYNQLLDDTIKLKKSPLDIKELQKTLALAKKSMNTIINEVGKELDKQRALLNQPS
jgi:arsenate reductase-like glutaredoxin family protein